MPWLDTTCFLEGEEQYHYLVVISKNSELLINLNTSCGRQGNSDCNCYHVQVRIATKQNIGNSGMDDTFVLLQIHAALESVAFHHFVLIEHEIFTYHMNVYGCLLRILVKNIIRNNLFPGFFYVSPMLCWVQSLAPGKHQLNQLVLSVLSSRWSCTASGCSLLWIQDESIAQIYYHFWPGHGLKIRRDSFYFIHLWWSLNPNSKSTYSSHCRYLHSDPTLQKFC